MMTPMAIHMMMWWWPNDTQPFATHAMQCYVLLNWVYASGSCYAFANYAMLCFAMLGPAHCSEVDMQVGSLIVPVSYVMLFYAMPRNMCEARLGYASRPLARFWQRAAEMALHGRACQGWHAPICPSCSSRRWRWWWWWASSTWWDVEELNAKDEVERSQRECQPPYLSD